MITGWRPGTGSPTARGPGARIMRSGGGPGSITSLAESARELPGGAPGEARDVDNRPPRPTAGRRQAHAGRGGSPGADGGAGRSRAARGLCWMWRPHGALVRAVRGPAGAAVPAGRSPAGRRCWRPGGTPARCARLCCATRSAGAATSPSRWPSCSPRHWTSSPRRPRDTWLVPAPSRPSAARARGGDHVLRLCRVLAAGRPDIRVAAPLRLARHARDSVGLDAAQRAANLAGRLRVRAARSAPARRRHAARGRRGHHRRHAARLPRGAGRVRGPGRRRPRAVRRHGSIDLIGEQRETPVGDDRTASRRVCPGRATERSGLLPNRDASYRASHRRCPYQRTADRAPGVGIPRQSATPTRR